MQVIAGVLGRAGEEGQRKRLEAAKTGVATWLPPPGLGRPDAREEMAKGEPSKGRRVVKSPGEDDEKALDSIKRKTKFTSSEDEEDL